MIDLLDPLKDEPLIILGDFQRMIQAGARVPRENERDVETTPDYVKTKLNIRFVTSIDEFLQSALMASSGHLDDATRL